MLKYSLIRRSLRYVIQYIEKGGMKTKGHNINSTGRGLLTITEQVIALEVFSYSYIILNFKLLYKGRHNAQTRNLSYKHHSSFIEYAIP